MAYHHFRAEEREVISQMLAAGQSPPVIAKCLHRDPTSIRRELRRNGFRGLYCAVHAQQLAERRRIAARARSRKLARPENREYVEQRLRKCWSPEQIAGRSQREFAADPRRKLSRQTIYTWLARNDHRRRWIVFLRHYKRRRRHARAPGRTDRALAKRPTIINQRGRFGDWEGDTIVGSGRHGGALISLVERKSGYLALLPVAARKAEPVRRSICGRLAQLPSELRQSLTFDNGSEFAGYAALEEALGTQVFFTDPHAPWQRGTNENTNGLVRQFFPKGTNLALASRYKVAKAEQLLNDRPRKRLNFQTPSEVLNAERCRALQT
jgi:transposase, IS30 family